MTHHLFHLSVESSLHNIYLFQLQYPTQENKCISITQQQNYNNMNQPYTTVYYVWKFQLLHHALQYDTNRKYKVKESSDRNEASKDWFPYTC